MSRLPKVRNIEKIFARKDGRRNINRRRGVGNFVLPPKRFVIQGLFPASRNVPPRSIQRLLKKWNGQRENRTNGFCEFCPFWDKKYHFCLIARVKNAPCPFANRKQNSISLTK